MEAKQFSMDVQIPSLDDILKTYGRYGTFLHGIGKHLYTAMMRPEVFMRAKVLTDFGHPAILATGDLSQKFWDEHGVDPKAYLSKQCAGAMMCVLMEANGYRKSGTRKKVSHPAYTIAEVYVPA